MSDNRNEYYEKLLTPGDCYVTTALAKLGVDAVPILEALFDGSAKNEWGHSYRNIGALGSGYVTAKLLGEVAKPLERYLREGVDKDHSYAIEALGRIGSLEDTTKISLANSLVRDSFKGAAYPLIKYNKHCDEDVLNIINNSDEAMYTLERTKNHLSKRNT